VHLTRIFCVPRLAGLAALLALAACSQSTEPSEPLAPVYLLTSVDGTDGQIVIGEHTYPSGTYQLYTLSYDSIQIGTGSQARRSFELTMYTRSYDGALVPPLVTPVVHMAQITRRGNRVIFAYDQEKAVVKADTFTLENGNLVKHGPYGVVCATCEPVRRVKYVYEPR
jgi:hypothetical protein